MSADASASALEQSLPAAAGLALEEAARLGADAAETDASASLGFSVTARAGDVETLEHGNERSFGVTVYFGARKGSASASDLAPESIAEAVKAACDFARYTSEDDCAGLADAGLMATEFPDLDLDRRWDLDIEHAIGVAVECEDEMRAVEKVVNTEGASVSTERSIHCYANTHGFSHTSAATRHSLSGIAVAGDDGGMQRDFWYSVHRHPDCLEPHREVGRRAGERAVRRLGARRLKTRKKPVLFEAALACGLLSQLAGAISGGALYRKTSFLLDALGERLFPSFVRIVERPHLPGALGSASFDAEGVATRERVIVEDGVLAGYLLDSYSARKLGMETTANAGGVHNWMFEGSTRPFDELLAEMGEGFFVTELMGQGANLVTGDYSRGAAGFWVEGGRIAYPVSEVTIAANLRDVFGGVLAAGDDVDERGRIRCGSLLIDGMTIAGD